MKMLVTTDGSASSMKAVEWAADRAEKGKDHVALISVVSFTQDLLAEMPPNIQNKLEVESRKALEKAKKVFEEKGLEVEVFLEMGTVPANNIIERAEDDKFDMIVIGSTGMTGLRRALMGSTASKVVSNAPCSVTVIR